MARMETLREIAVSHAKKMPGMVDSLLEEAPILERLKWKASTHGLWNMTEALTDVVGPGFVNMNAELPSVGASSGLEKVDLQIMGGTMEAPDDTLNQAGGPGKYFSDKQPRVLKKAGNDTEKNLYYNNWRAYALDNRAKQVINAGGTGTALGSIVIVRLDELGCTGLYDQSCFAQGTLLKVEPINGGNLYALMDPKYKNVLGRGVMLKGYFGWQLMDPRCVSAIVNIDMATPVTPTMLADAIDMARGKPGNTFIFCAPRVYTHAISPNKTANIVVKVEDKKISTEVNDVDGIPIVTSHNLLGYAETAV